MKNLTLLISTLFILACGSGKIHIKSTGAKGLKGSEATKSSGDWKTLYLTAYSKEVYPFAVEKCGSCHSGAVTPHFASADPTEGALSVLESNKIDFSAPSLSRLVLRFTQDRHNCGEREDCDKLGAEMRAKIDALIGSIPPNPEIKITERTDELVLAQVVDSNRPVLSNPGFIVLEGETLNSLNPGMNLEIGTAGSVSFAKLPATDVTFNAPMKVEVASTFFLWARYRTGGGAALTMPVFNYLNVLGGQTNSNGSIVAKPPGAPVAPALPNPNVQARNFPLMGNTNAAFQWSMVNQVQNMVIRFYAGVQAQTVPVVLTGRNLDLDMLVLTDIDFSKKPEKAPSLTKKVLNFDLAKLGIEGGRIEMEASIIDPEGSKTYKFEAPRYFGPGNVKMKGMKILVNGAWNPVQSLFMAIDTVVKDGDFLTSLGMIVSKDKGEAEDKFALSFDEIVSQ